MKLLGDTESYLNGSMDNDHKLVVKEELENDEECFKKALNLCTSLQNYKGKYIVCDIYFYIKKGTLPPN